MIVLILFDLRKDVKSARIQAKKTCLSKHVPFAVTPCRRSFSASNFSAENGSPTRFSSSRSTTRGFVCSRPLNSMDETTTPSEQPAAPASGATDGSAKAAKAQHPTRRPTIFTKSITKRKNRKNEARGSGFEARAVSSEVSGTRQEASEKNHALRASIKTEKP